MVLRRSEATWPHTLTGNQDIFAGIQEGDSDG
ncbi:MAG: hypothetical protein JWN15_249 [Firmicutes bacterium]|nr:hypothetical protein [Bacillota bacterium]